VHSLISSLSSVLIALLFKPIALFLVLSDLLGRMLSIMSFHKAFAISDLFNITSKQRSLKERYSKFSTFEQITSFLSIASLQLPIIVIPFIFGTQVGGFYFIIYRVLTAPISLISNAVLDVFKSDASRDFNNTGSTRNIFISTTKKLFLIGLIPFTILVFFAPEIFTLMFGSEWLKAGEYAQILAPSLLLRLVACPIGFILQLREKVELNLFIYGLFFILSSLSLFAAYIYDSVVIMVILISVSTCIFYAVQLYFAFIYSGKIVINSNV
jgi:O-antigen/teichoic acid export membrane protein